MVGINLAVALLADREIGDSQFAARPFNNVTMSLGPPQSGGGK